jgi:hypothetical protein
MITYLADKAENLSAEGPSATFTYRRIGPQGGVPLVLLNRFRGTVDEHRAQSEEALEAVVVDPAEPASNSSGVRP